MEKEIRIGDNLIVLQQLIDEHKTYKVIYIDPPYNTKTKKSYKDKSDSDEWLSFMESRLALCPYLMTDDGVIFISIDDNEYAYLKVLCDKIFSRENCLGTFITMQSQRSNAKHINIIHEYVLCYAKNKKRVPALAINRSDIPEQKVIIDDYLDKIQGITNEAEIRKINENICKKYNITWLRNYSYIDDNGNIYFPTDLSVPSKPREVNIPEIGLHLDPLPTRGWASDKKFIDMYKENRLVFRNGRPYTKYYLSESKDNISSILPFYSRQGTKDLKDLGMDGIFDTPKPVCMLKYLLKTIINNNDNVLDFFAGSGSIGQAVYEIEMENKINLGFTLIQIDAPVEDKNSEVYKTCLKYNVNPNIKDILQYRLNTFIKQNNIKDIFLCKE